MSKTSHVVRGAGVLLHLSSLPGPHGHGDLGPEAHKFADFLQRSHQRYWQMLPIHPVGAGNSPYSGVSAFAGNPMLISLDQLVDEGLLAKRALPSALAAGHLDYTRAKAYRLPLLLKAFVNYQRKKAELSQRSHSVPRTLSVLAL
jgi:4-alpha-glucanotransferase